MQKLETRNGTLVFVEVPENCPQYEYREKESMPLCLMVGYHFGTPKRLLHSPRILPECENGYEILGEVTKEGITFSPESFVEEYYKESTIKPEYYLRRAMVMNGIKLREGFKFIVLKEKL